MKPTSYQNLSASKGEFHGPLSKPNLSSSSELHPSLKAMVQAQPFSGLKMKTLAITCTSSRRCVIA
jgi:hypothetical protein